MIAFDRRTILTIALGLIVADKAKAQSSIKYAVSIRSFEDAYKKAVPAIEQSDLVVKKDDSEAAKELIARAPPDRAAPVVLIIIGAVAAINISKMLVELVRSTYYGGVVIDARGEPAQISNDVKIPAGLVIVIAKDGTTTTFKESDITTDFVNAILSKVK